MREKRPLVWPEYRSVSSPSFLTLTLLPALSLYHSIRPQSYCFNCTLINFTRTSRCLPTFNSSLCTVSIYLVWAWFGFPRRLGCESAGMRTGCWWISHSWFVWTSSDRERQCLFRRRRQQLTQGRDSKCECLLDVIICITAIVRVCAHVRVCVGPSMTNRCASTKGKPHISSHPWRWH